MILKGSQRGGARQLAIHLLKVDENEHVEIHEISGFVSEDLDGALREIHAISQGTRCKQFMFSLSLNPPQSESVPVVYFEKALTDIEKELKLENQPRAIVFHEKEGRRHCHAVWSRIDTDEMKAINLPYFKMKLQDISRQLYFQYGWQMPRGLMNKEGRNPLNFTLKEWQQAKRLQEDPKIIKQLLQDCWAVSDDKASLAKALNEYGFYLAKGDRRGFVAIDYRGEVFSLSRWMDVKTKDLKARLGNLEALPSTKEVHAQISGRMSQMLETYIQQVQSGINKSLEPFRQKKAALQKYHRTQRQAFIKKQEERSKEEQNERYQRLPQGFKALWSRMTGRYKKIRAQNEREVKNSTLRDREEKQALIDRQLTDRQNLQDQVRPIKRKHNKLIVQLKMDVAEYMAMGDPEQKALQDKLNQVDQEDQRQTERGRNYGYGQEM
jgi:relaxase-like protein